MVQDERDPPRQRRSELARLQARLRDRIERGRRRLEHSEEALTRIAAHQAVVLARTREIHMRLLTMDAELGRWVARARRAGRANPDEP